MIKATPAKKKQIKRLHDGGASQRDIAKAVGLSPGTVNGVIQEYRAKAAAPAPTTEQTPPVGSVDLDALPEDPADVPAELDVDFASRLVRRLERALATAEASGNMGSVASLSAKITALLEHIRKATPAPKQDPNELPDMIAARDTALARMHKLVAQALEEADSSPFV